MKLFQSSFTIINEYKHILSGENVVNTVKNHHLAGHRSLGSGFIKVKGQVSVLCTKISNGEYTVYSYSNPSISSATTFQYPAFNPFCVFALPLDQL